MTAAATVYLVTNTVNGHQYVGVTRFTPERRWSGHVETAKRRPKSYLHRAIAKYGADAFRVESLASCLSDAGTVERLVIQQVAPVYNQTNGGEVTTGRRGGPEFYAGIAAKNRGLKRTAETKALQSTKAKTRHSSNPIYRTLALEALQKARSFINQQKRIAAASEACRTRVWSDESRAKLSASCMGRVYEHIKRPVKCVELDAVFSSAAEAAAHTGVSMSCVRHQCLYAKRRRRNTNGFTFHYI